MMTYYICHIANSYRRNRLKKNEFIFLERLFQRPMTKLFNDQFLTYVEPSTWLTIDESMINWSSPFAGYIKKKSKPIPRGFEAFSIADSLTGYVTSKN